jgi:hypothetical protein
MINDDDAVSIHAAGGELKKCARQTGEKPHINWKILVL